MTKMIKTPKIELHHGDCLDVMDEMIKKGVKVDLIMTDPPYGMSYQSNSRTDTHKKIAGDDNLDWLPDFAEKCSLLVKDDTAHYVFCSWHKIDVFKQEFQKYFTIKNILVWDKGQNGMGDLQADFGNSVEFILFLQKGRRLMNGKREPNVLKYQRTLNNLHPTEKPVALIEYLIGKFSDPGQLVFDPFMGSGTTGVACKHIDRSFIGAELEEGYFKTAKKRIHKAKSKNTKLDEW